MKWYEVAIDMDEAEGTRTLASFDIDKLSDGLEFIIQARKDYPNNTLFIDLWEDSRKDISENSSDAKPIDTVLIWEAEKETAIGKENLKNLEEFAKSLGIEDGNEGVDELVHDLKSKEDSSINNEGLSSQLAYILEVLGLEKAKKEIAGLA